MGCADLVSISSGGGEPCAAAWHGVARSQVRDLLGSLGRVSTLAWGAETPGGVGRPRIKGETVGRTPKCVLATDSI